MFKQNRILLTSLLLLLVFTSMYSQKTNVGVVSNKQMTENQIIREGNDYRFNLMLNAGGVVVWGSISGSILLTDFMSVDIGLGLGKIYAGTTFYLKSPFNNSNWQPYVGANIAYFEEFMGPVSRLVYIPAGLRFLNYRGTSISFEIALLLSNNDRFLIESPVWGGIRVGKYF